MRGNVWDPASWDPEAMPSRAQIAQRLERPEESLQALERSYGAQYARGRYPSERV